MIYLDNAATTMNKPKQVIDAVAHAMEHMGNSGRGVNDASLDAARSVFGCRVKLAQFFGAKDPTQVVFTCNATEALNIAIKGLFENGDHVVTSPMEHNSVLRPLYELEDKGMELSFVPVDTDGVIHPYSFNGLIKENTKAIIVTHGSNLTGNLTDIEAIGKIAKEHNLLFIVDASQTAGVFPIDMENMNIDVLCFTGHKSLLGPQGTGGLIVRQGLEICPLKCGGTGVQTYNKYQPIEMPTHLEAGTLNGHGIAGLSAAIDYINEEGMDKIRGIEQDLAHSFYEQITAISGVKVYGDFSSKNRCPIVSLNIGDYDSATVGDILYSEYEISIRSGGHCAPMAHRTLGTQDIGAVRFSFSHYNTQDDVDAAVTAIREIAQ